MKLRFYFIVSFTILAIATRCSSNKYTPVSSDVPTPEVAYTTHIKPIIDNFCITCHGGNSPSANLPLNTFEDVRRAAENGPLLKRINDASHPMPVGGLMPKNERIMFNKWKGNQFMEIGNIDSSVSQTNSYDWTPKPVIPVDIESQNVELLTQLPGHWVGDMVLMGEKVPWFSWDYRPIAASHVHGIFEGGSMGNLFNSIFIANFNGTKTLMTRNGGILNGIYRTSYFVLVEAKVNSNESYYRLVDAYGNDEIMWMEFTFKGDQMNFTSYTSRFGTYPKPTKHMQFKGKVAHNDLSDNAAKQVGFPSNQLSYDFSKGLPTPIWAENVEPTSATYLWTDTSSDIDTMGTLSKDPIPMKKVPFVASLNVSWELDSLNEHYPTQIYLSRKSLCNEEGQIPMEYGYINMDKMNEVVLNSEINKAISEFQFHYLHPGEFYLTRWIDLDGNYAPSKGDKFIQSVKVSLAPKDNKQLHLNSEGYSTL